MKERKNIPEIRFKGFEGEWEEKKLLNVVFRVTRKNTNLESTLPLTISAQYGLVDQVTYFNNRVASRDVSRYYLLNKGEFAYNKSYSEGFPFGAVKRLDLYDKGVLSTLYIIFSINTDFLDSDFLVSYYDSDYWHKQVSERAAEGARNHGLLNISADSFFDTTLKYSKDKEEQSQIGTFFQSLDKQITLEQQKHDKLVTLKKAMLEKMFPKEGARVPEIRFEGFEGEWEVKRLGEISNTYSGGTPSVGVIEYYNGRIPFIRSAEINSNSTELYITDLGLKNSSAKLVNAGCILYALYGATSGEVGRAKLKGAINQAVLAIEPIAGIDSDFIVQYLRKKKKEITNTYLQGGQGNLSASIVKAVNVYLPPIEEQSQIGSYFQNLDKLISLQQQKIDKLKNIKKACLEKMFV